MIITYQEGQLSILYICFIIKRHEFIGFLLVLFPLTQPRISIFYSHFLLFDGRIAPFFTKMNLLFLYFWILNILIFSSVKILFTPKRPLDILI